MASVNVTKLQGIRDSAAKLITAIGTVETAQASADTALKAKENADATLVAAEAELDSTLNGAQTAQKSLINAFNDAFDPDVTP